MFQYMFSTFSRKVRKYSIRNVVSWIVVLKFNISFIISNHYFEILHIVKSLTEPLCNERPVVRISATQLGALVSSWFSFIKTDQNFRHQKKSFKNTWKDLQRRRCSTSWAVLPCSARPLGPTNVDKTSLKEKINDKR